MYRDRFKTVIKLSLQLSAGFGFLFSLLPFFDDEKLTFIEELELASGIFIIFFLFVFVVVFVILVIIWLWYYLFDKGKLSDKYVKQKTKAKRKITPEIIQALEDTKKESIKITAAKSKKLNPWDSKFGGVPYLPKGKSIPKTRSGKELTLLAQINFSDLPKNNLFPSKGLLQFYILGGTSYGLNPKPENITSQIDTAKVIFIRDIIEIETFKTDQAVQYPKYFPLRDSYKLEFKVNQEYISRSDKAFHEWTKKHDKEDIIHQYDDLELEKTFEIDLSGMGHKLSGYPFFTQWDPRVNEVFSNDEYELLFQMDSEGDILWGDSGVANFFIKKEDLRKHNFSNVLYNWDCY
jgi:uncharacterized protein YwqG